jgi:hypothetical protein
MAKIDALRQASRMGMETKRTLLPGKDSRRRRLVIQRPATAEPHDWIQGKDTKSAASN